MRMPACSALRLHLGEGAPDHDAISVFNFDNALVASSVQIETAEPIVSVIYHSIPWGLQRMHTKKVVL